MYAERAQLVANIAAQYDAAISLDPAEPMCPAVVYVHTPAGQLSWHIAAPDLRYFEHVEAAESHQTQLWDGHATAEKYRRLRELTGQLAAEHHKECSS